ncbi:MAG: PEGA domain-containing protein [Kiritimatiellae bacterium]|nr:PEGA domain-containing protein [Kiritimatiellia bacterium]
MKKLLPILFCAVLPGLAHADAVKAMLVVQNHASEEFKKPLSNVGTRLSTALSGNGQFEIIDPNDAVGDDQNRGVWGEKMPASAATRLAENLGAQALITASIDDVSEIETAGAVRQLSVTMTLQAKRIPSGASVGGEEVTVLSRKYTLNEYKTNNRPIYSQLISELCKQGSSMFLSKMAGVKWEQDAANKVMVAFGCNYPGADVSIDGFSYGTAGTIGEAPLQIPVSPGNHNLTVSYPFALPYNVRAMFMANSTYLVTLEPTEEGRRRAKDDAYFAELLDRAHKSGATDDFCRTEKAKGYAQYLASSHTRIEGMPQVLTKWNWGSGKIESPDLGLKPAGGSEKPVETTDAILKKAGEAVNGVK